MTDLTHGMLEPCIMDIKIGRRTWDPLASAEKKATEEVVLDIPICFYSDTYQ